MTMNEDRGDFMQRWECDAPPLGASFRVKDDEWDLTCDPPVRVIREIEMLSFGPVADSPRGPMR